MSLIGLVRAVGFLLAGIIVLGIVLVVLGASEENAIVELVLSVDRFLTEPFRGIFDLERGRETLQIAVNWGIAAVVYLVVALLLAAGLRALSRSRGSGGRSAGTRRGEKASE